MKGFTDRQIQFEQVFDGAYRYLDRCGDNDGLRIMTATPAITTGVLDVLDPSTGYESSRREQFETHAANPVFGDTGVSRAGGDGTRFAISRPKAGATTRVKRKFQGILVPFVGERSLRIVR